ncbi:hypothetical protein TNCV_2467851 [Trichonephila clavipes]|nr:hypothetical protein TNCV_2467851 [Trichonephila clavipes]
MLIQKFLPILEAYFTSFHESSRPRGQKKQAAAGKSLDTRHRQILDNRYRVLPWPEDCTVVVCLHDALYYDVTLSPAHRRRRSLVPGTPELQNVQ